MDQDIVHVIIALFICAAMIISPAAALNTGGPGLNSSMKNSAESVMDGMFRTPTYTIPDSAMESLAEYDAPEYAPDSIIVRYCEGAEIPEAGIVGAEVIAGASGLLVVPVPAGMTIEEAVALYGADPNVLYAEPNYIRTIDVATEEEIQALIESYVAKAESMPAAEMVNPDDDYFYALWGLWNTGLWMDSYTSAYPGCDIAAPGAWQYTNGSSDIVVAVLDTGVWWNHTDLAANMWINVNDPIDGIDNDGNGYVDDYRGWDFVNDDNDPADDNGHGTHCAGTIGAVGDNGVGVAGVTWHVRIMPLKAFNAAGSGDDADIIEALEYAAMMGADVISNSWGSYDYSQTTRDVIDNTTAVVVCSAGNDGLDTDVMPHYPSGYDCENIISVAATNWEDDLVTDPPYWWGSNYGYETVDVAAPGQWILSTVPNGTGIEWPNPDYDWNSGTSMAAPHVSGLAALLMSADPTLSNLEVKQVILDNVDYLDLSVLTGGRINAYNAVADLYPPLPVHNIDTGIDYGTIQEAINATETTDGDTIVVDNGTYIGWVFVDKGVTVEAAYPSGAYLDANGRPWGFAITADGATVRGFVVYDTDVACIYSGIFIYADDVTVDQNYVFNTSQGILVAGDDCTVSENVVIENHIHGIAVGHYYTGGAHGCTLYNNFALLNRGAGLRVAQSTGNNVTLLITGLNGWAGLSVGDNSDNNRFSDILTAMNDDSGIRVGGTSGNVFFNFTTFMNDNNGLTITECICDTAYANTNTFTGGLVGINLHDGIYMQNSSGNRFTDIMSVENYNSGINLTWSDNNLFDNLTAIGNNEGGFVFVESDRNRIIGGSADYNEAGVLMADQSSFNLLNGMNLSYNTIVGGAIVFEANNNTVRACQILNNSEYGFLLADSSDNRIYDNFFNNTRNAIVLGVNSGTLWNVTMATGPNIVGGPLIGGNFWATPAGDGWSETHDDTTRDGFCDDPFNFNGTEWDYLPLNVPYADFSVSSRSGVAPFTVTFTDTSGLAGVDADYYNWTFGDGGYTNFYHDTTIQHTYTVPGIYDVTMYVTNIYGNDTVLKTDWIYVYPAQYGTGGGGSGGGTGTGAGTGTQGTPTEEKTVTASDGIAKLTIPAGTQALDKDGNPLGDISIVPLADIPKEPEGLFSFAGYAWQCTPAGATFDPPITLTLTFTAEEWAALDPASLTLEWYNPATGLWETIPAVIDPVSHTVTAQISHFSVFALFEAAEEVVIAEETTAATAAPTTAAPTTAPTTQSPLVFAPVLALGAIPFLARRK